MINIPILTVLVEKLLAIHVWIVHLGKRNRSSELSTSRSLIVFIKKSMPQYGWKKIRIDVWNCSYKVHTYILRTPLKFEKTSSTSYLVTSKRNGRFFCKFCALLYYNTYLNKSNFKIWGHSITTWTRWGREGVKKCRFLSTLRA